MPSVIHPPNVASTQVPPKGAISAQEIAHLIESNSETARIKQLLDQSTDKLATIAAGQSIELLHKNPSSCKQSTEHLVTLATTWYPSDITPTNVILHSWSTISPPVLCTLLFQLPHLHLDIQPILKHALEWSKTIDSDPTLALTKGDLASSLLNLLIAQHLSSTSVTGTDTLPSPTTEFVASVTMNHMPKDIQAVLDADLAFPALALASYLVAPVQRHRDAHQHAHRHHLGSNVYRHAIDTLAEHCLAQYADGFTSHLPQGFKSALREVVKTAAEGKEGAKEEAVAAVMVLKRVDPKFT
ncbi:hypothetical protein BCR44DRAFT_76000 [Catenaria anguillulae PL171]|uniref:Uncharacterized protein n=1 Tax=Catenaria anguillulae PL171 TaxID=765915 RepID=A0A1Y2HQ62_9FUNG|nr:hypothetical protein BCR44DRAFT_76000 [Catenaria anguillulae PL171]